MLVQPHRVQMHGMMWNDRMVRTSLTLPMMCICCSLEPRRVPRLQRGWASAWFCPDAIALAMFQSLEIGVDSVVSAQSAILY